MHKLSLLLLFWFVLLKATSQPGSLDSSFGNNGVQTTAFNTNVNFLSEQGRVVLSNADGDFYVVMQVNERSYIYSGSTRIARYLPDGRLDSSYGNAGFSVIAANLNIASAAMQGDKILVTGNTGDVSYSDFAVARYTADGKLDSSFGENGKVITDFGSGFERPNAIALQGGNIIVVGNIDGDFAVARYTMDGVLDASFGVNGKVITDIGAYDDATSIAIQGDKIVVGGNTGSDDNYDFALVCYTSDGRIDSSFGEHGKVTTDLNNSSNDYATSIVLQGDKVILGGHSYNYNDDSEDYTWDFAIARYTSDGELDSSFGINGKTITNFNGRHDRANSIALQGDKILMGGTTYYTTEEYAEFIEDFALARYTADGKLDTSFGVNGKVITDFGSVENYANSIVLQENKIILAGAKYNPNVRNNDFALERYTAIGALDLSFGNNGLLTGYSPSTGSSFASTAIQGNKVVAAGYTITGPENYRDFALARYNADGTLDAMFGVNGKATTDFTDYFEGSDDYATSVALQGDKIIVAGNSYNKYLDNPSISLARYTSTGSLDSTFGENGKVINEFNFSEEFATSMALQGDKIIVGGYTGYYSNNFTLIRYTADGKLDASFGVNGKVITKFEKAEYARATSIILQGDNILVAGYIGDYVNSDFALARYTADGKLDVSFGRNGIITTDFNNADDRATAIALQSDKIIVGGTTFKYENDKFNYGFALARYTADGKLDATFGNNGKVITDFNNSSNAGATSIALQDKKIILGGYSGNYDYSDLTIAGYSDNGILDSSFGVKGKVITNLGGTASIQAIALQQNRLYAVGSVDFNSDERYGVVAAYQLESSKPTISIADVTVSESKRFAVVTVRSSAPATKMVRVYYTIRNKTATAPKDYLRVKGALLFIPDVNTTAKIFIPIVDDNACEATEQFEILLINAYNASIQDSVGVVTILDDDCALITMQESTSLHIHVSPNPSTGTFTVQLQGSDHKQPVSIRVYNVSGRLLEEREHVNIGQSLRLGYQYKPGTYIIEAVHNSGSMQTKAIRTGQ